MRCPRAPGRVAVSDRPRSLARKASRCSSTWSHGAGPEAHTRGSRVVRAGGRPARYGPCQSNELTPGMVDRRVENSPDERPRAPGTIGIHDECPPEPAVVDPSLESIRPVRSAQVFFGPRPRTARRREQEHDSRSSAPRRTLYEQGY